MATEKEMKARRKKKLEKEFGAMYSSMGAKNNSASKVVQNAKKQVSKKVAGKSMTAGRPKPLHVVTSIEISPAMLMKFVVDYIKRMMNGAPPPMPSGNVTAVEYDNKSVDRMTDRGYYSFDARVSGFQKPYYRGTVNRSDVNKDWERPQSQGRRTRSAGGRKSGLATDGARDVIEKQRRKQQSPVSMTGMPRDAELPIKREKSAFSTSSLSSGGFGGGYQSWGVGYSGENSAYVGAGKSKPSSKVAPQVQGAKVPRVTNSAVKNLLSRKV